MYFDDFVRCSSDRSLFVGSCGTRALACSSSTQVEVVDGDVELLFAPSRCQSLKGREMQRLSTLKVAANDKVE